MAEDAQGLAPNVLNFSIGLFKEVKPRAITRDIDWGIPVPVPGWIDNPNKRLYVWFDAVIGYLSASIEWARRSGDPEAWRAWWNDPATPGYYFMGKDNITFHSQIWPSEMLAYNGEGSKGGEPGELGRLDLPEQVVASEFMTMEGKKFSSSRGIVIYVKDILSRYPVDAGALLHLGRRSGVVGLRLHVGRVRAPEQRGARRLVGQSGEPCGESDRQELRPDPADRGGKDDR